MIPEAREVRLKPKIRKVLEARCRAPTTVKRDAQRTPIVLLAAEGRSTRSIATEVGVQPRIVSKWRHRFADHERARSRSTAWPRTSAFWRFWISRRLKGMPVGQGRCWPLPFATLTFNMSGASCASTGSILPPASRGPRATTPRLRRAQALFEAAERTRPDRAEP